MNLNYKGLLKDKIAIVIEIVVLSIISSVLFCYIAIMNQQIVDNAFLPDGINYLVGLLPNVTIVLGSVLITETVNARNKAKLTSKYITDIQKDFYVRIIDTRFLFLTSVSPNDIYYRMFIDASIVSEYIIQVITTIPINILTIIIIFYAMTRWSINLAIFVVVCVIIQVIIVRVFSVPIKKSTEKYRSAEQNVAKQVLDGLKNVDVVKSYKASGWFAKRINAHIDNLYVKKMDTQFLTVFFSAVTSLVGTFWSIGLLLLSVLLATKGKMTVGDYFGLSILAGYLYAPIQQLANMDIGYQQVKVSNNRILSYLCERDENHYIENNTFSFENSIRIQDLGFKYKTKNVFSNLNITIRKGETVIITGVSGSGKTTFARIISKIIYPERGHVYIDDLDVLEIDTNDLCNNIGYMPQSPVIFEASLYDNIDIGRNNSVKDVKEVACLVGLEPLLQDLNNTVDTFIGPSKRDLSSGEKQRVCLARALIGDPPILLLDEPTASLDLKTTKEIAAHLNYYIKNHQTTSVIITHDSFLIENLENVTIYNFSR